MTDCRSGARPGRLMRAGLLCVALMLGAPGCGDSDGAGRIAVEGNVSLEGAAVVEGYVSFRPAQGTSGPAAGPAVILDGAFSLPAERGPVAGDYLIVVTLESSDKSDKLAQLNGEDAADDSEPSPSPSPSGRWQYDVKIPAGKTWRYDIELDDEHRVAAR